MLFASPSNFCLRRLFTFLTSEARLTQHYSFLVVQTRTWLICYLMRTSINFAHFAGFSGVIIHGPNRSEIDRHLCRRDERIRRNPSQNAAFFAKSEQTIKHAVALSSPVSTVYACYEHLGFNLRTPGSFGMLFTRCSDEISR